MIIRIIIDVLLVMGAFFALSGVIGVIRMKDTYCRMQATTNIATLGSICIFVAGLLYACVVEQSAAMAIKIIIVGIFLVITNPVSSHAICKAAYKIGIKSDKDLVCNDYERGNSDD